MARALVVVDLPFLSYQVSVREAVRNAGQVLKETRAPAVKLEGGKRWAPTVDALVTAGIPVMGHIGLTPQSLHVAGEIKVQGRDDQAAERLVEDALCLQEAGAFAIVLEFVSAAVAQRISQAVEIPTIGIGAGPHCDGQVLVLYDLLGFGDGPRGKFVKRYAELEAAVEGAVTRFADEVRGRAFPDEAHTHR